MDPEFDAALAIVLRKIADEPTRLNQLSHDVLRKLILVVGNLQNARVINVHGVEYSVNRLEEALRIDTKASFDEMSDRSDIRISKCNYCERVHVWSGYEAWRLEHCMCKNCPNLLCTKHSYTDCPVGKDTYMCKTCIPYDLDTYPRKCDACSSSK